MATFQSPEGAVMDRSEMIKILEELILDESTNATAKCTAIRTLRELQGDELPESKSRGVRGPGRLAAAARC